jgi:cell division protein FtsL
MKNIIILILGILFVITVFFGVKASSEGMTLVALNEKAQELQQQNQELKDQIVSSTSLSQVAKQSDSLGLIKPEKYVYLTQQGIALR